MNVFPYLCVIKRRLSFTVKQYGYFARINFGTEAENASTSLATTIDVGEPI